MTDEDRSPKFFALHVETSSKFIGGCDLILAIILAANAISCLLYGTAWLNLAIGILTLSAAILALVSLYFGFDKKESIYLIVPIIFQTITICWCIMLVLAGIFSVTSGHLWPLQSIIGIKPPEIKVSKDIRDDNYISPDDTNPETNRGLLLKLKKLQNNIYYLQQLYGDKLQSFQRFFFSSLNFGHLLFLKWYIDIIYNMISMINIPMEIQNMQKFHKKIFMMMIMKSFVMMIILMIQILKMNNYN
jgi:hypothetical protein